MRISSWRGRWLVVVFTLGAVVLLAISFTRPSRAASGNVPTVTVSGAWSGGLNVASQRDAATGALTNAPEVIAPLDSSFVGAPPDQPISGRKP
jgi:hypothetical protein